MSVLSVYRGPKVRNRAAIMLISLAIGNIAAWIAAFAVSGAYSHYLPLAWLAYGFGLRHAVDADHICAIDNTTRKLMQDGKRPIGVGFFFSLGHSTVVLLLCALTAVAAGYARTHIPGWQEFGGKIGTGVSTAFLFIIGTINLVVFVSLFKAARSRHLEDEHHEQKIDEILQQQGLLGRIFRPILRTISHSWQMYFVGFLFGLGFDTATEVGMLSLAAQQSATGLSFASLMLLPALFTLGMCLIDALNGVLMLGAYGWAFINPRRKLVYNFAIVIISVVVAFAVATKQLCELNGVDLMSFKGRLGGIVNNDLGFVIVGVFLLGWLLSAAVYRLRNGADVGAETPTLLTGAE